jgi:hypothetical protein
VIANGCLRKEARREHLDYINKGLLSKPDQGAKLALAYCDTYSINFSRQVTILLFLMPENCH